MPDPIELRHLKNFIAVAEAGNISRAAEIFFISQSCLSEQMKQLEETIQVDLFVRHHGGVHATPAAGIVIAGGKQVLKLLALLDSGDIDAALLTLPVSGAGLKTYVLTYTRLVACMRADDPL